MKTPFAASLLVLSINLFPTPGHAAWSVDGNVISAATNYQHDAVLVPDGVGGAIIAWADFRNGNEDIYAQRVNASGAAMWTPDGVVICNAAFDQGFHAITTDGSGGAIVTWRDRRGGTFTDIYAQRINPAGVVQWTANGVLICGAANDQQYPAIVADGSGGATVTWEDPRVGMGVFRDIYAQKINALGLVQWTANGVLLCNAGNEQTYPMLASDGSGGAIVAWQDLRSSATNDIYAQRINAAGAVQWLANGVAICAAANHQFTPQVASDAAGGAIITWSDVRVVSNSNIYAQRINSAGTVQWTADGVALCTATNDQWTFSLDTDGAGGVIAAWWDRRTGGYDVYARRIDSTGTPLWTPDGVAICTAADEQGIPKLTADGAGGAIVVWHDNRNGAVTAFDIYAQRINSAGAAQWTANGVALCTATKNQMVPGVASDGNGGAIVAWQDLRNGNENNDDDDIYARRVLGSGSLPTPVRPMTPAASLSVGESYPNPFTAETSFDVTLRHESTVSVEVFDAAGRRVRSMEMGRIRAGAMRLTFDGRDERAHTLPSGVYFYRLRAGAETVTKKMVIAR